jgi:hypothetical protein
MVHFFGGPVVSAPVFASALVSWRMARSFPGKQKKRRFFTKTAPLVFRMRLFVDSMRTCFFPETQKAPSDSFKIRRRYI